MVSENMAQIQKQIQHNNTVGINMKNLTKSKTEALEKEAFFLTSCVCCTCKPSGGFSFSD